jgi:hypothetical protein
MKQVGETPAPPVITAQHLGGLTGQIVVASGGYDMVINYFARIVADFPHEVVLESLKSEETSGDGQRGTVVANINSPSGMRLIAFKSRSEDGSLHFWGGGNLYSLWDGTPQDFDYLD